MRVHTRHMYFVVWFFVVVCVCIRLDIRVYGRYFLISVVV